MTVAIVGGLDRLAPHYSAITREHGELEIRIYNRYKPGLGKRIASVDGIVLCTDVVSHSAAREVYRLARENQLAVACSHRSSVSAVRRAVESLADGRCCPSPCPGCSGGCGCEGRGKQ